MKRAVIYARFSSDKQSEASIDAQVRACTEYAEKNCFNIVDSYLDEAVSGKTTNRASYQRMMKDLKKDKYDIILIHKYDRIARNLGDHINLQQKLNEQDVKLVAVAQDFGEGKEAKLMMGIQWILSEYYVDNLTEEVRKGMKEVALKGEHTGGYPPFGYDVVNKKYVINFVEAEYVKRMYQCVLDGIGYTDLINEMKEKGITGKRGKPISRTAIYEILRNRKYTGTFLYSLAEEKDRKNRRDKPNAIVVENAMPVIIEQDKWEKVQMLLEKKKNNPHQTYMCSGKVYCKCGAKMHYIHSRKGTHEYFYYGCSKHCGAHTIKAEIVDNMVNMYLEEFKTQEFKEALTEQLKKYSADKLQMEIAFEEERKSRVAAKQKEIDNILSNLASGVLSPTVMNICNEKLEALNIELEQIKTLKPFTNYTPETIGAWLEAIVSADKSELPAIVIDRIEVNDDEVTVISTLSKIIEKSHDENRGNELVAGVRNDIAHEISTFISMIPSIYYGKKYKK